MASENFVRFLCRHFVSLCFHDVSPGQNVEFESIGTPHFVSAFLVEANGSLYLMTAGHVLEDIEFALKNGQKLRGWCIDDSCGLFARHEGPIPFPDFLETPKRHINFEGLDYGMIYLRPYYAALLAKMMWCPFVKATGEVNRRMGFATLA